jgi:hypothetical protein
MHAFAPLRFGRRPSSIEQFGIEFARDWCTQWQAKEILQKLPQ